MPLHNPFPSSSSLPFISGRLFCSLLLPPPSSFPIGNSFLLLLNLHHSSSFTLCHLSQPLFSLWSTPPSTESFLSAALASPRVHHSRGSFSIHDSLHLLCPHQTIERIRPLSPSGLHADVYTPRKVDADGKRIQIQGPLLIIEGCLYSDAKTAQAQLANYDELATRGIQEPGPFYDSDDKKFGACLKCNSPQCAGVRYSLIFSEQRDGHLGFTLQLHEPTHRALSNPCRCFLQNSRTSRHLSTNDNRIKQLVSKTSVTYVIHFFDRLLCLRHTKAHSAFGRLKHRLSSLTGLKRVICSIIPWSKKVHHLVDNQIPLNTLDTAESVRLPAFNRIVLTYSTNRSEKFFGFGEQFSYFDMKGRRIPVLVQEQGLGRGDQPITAAANLVAYRSGGDWHTTYAPVPFYMTSELRSLFLEGYSYSVFDLRKPDRVQIQVHSNQIQGRILHGRTPLQLIERYTQAIGRMRELPDWILRGAVVGMQGGTELVRRVWEQLQNLDAPISAFWLQDWVGKRKTSIGWQLWWNWEVDTDHYPGWDELMEDLRAENVRTMTYLNPFLAATEEKMNRKKNLFEEARSRGFLVHNKSGLPYMIPNTSFEAALIDLTNPGAWNWLKSIMHELARSGIRGWMADFGEGLPFDATLFSGEDAASLHNRYPELWAKLNRQLIEEWKELQHRSDGSSQFSGISAMAVQEAQGKEDERDNEESLVFFMRAGYRDSPRWATLFWEGDQMVSWQRHDGIKSAVVGLLTSGLCGYAFNHSDIGGYCTVDLPFLRYRRSEELLLRWMELNAFTTIYRTHEGNLPSSNSQFYSNHRSLSQFARFAKVYNAWEFYRRQLVKEAAATGLPVVRHLFLHYPKDQYVNTITYQQFLVGCEFLVVPILDKGRTKVEAYFPAGQDQWQHIWSGKIYGVAASSHQPTNGGLKAWIDCPLGYPAVFVKHGSPVGLRFLHNLTDRGILQPESH